MIRRWFPFLFCLTVVLSAAHFSAARRSSLRVNEAAIKLHFNDQQADVVFALDNNTGASFAARIEIELLDARDEVRTNTVLKETIRTGTSSITMPLVFHYAGLNETERRKFPLYRLRYRVRTCHR